VLPAASGVEVSPILLVFIGFTVGVVGGFIGIGGGYMVTPALIVFGFPGHLAVGTDITHIFGKSVISSIRHWHLGNVDVKLGLLTVAGTLLGIELGVRILNHLKGTGLSDVAVLGASLAMLVGIGSFMAWESRKSIKLLDKWYDEGKPLPSEVYASGLSKRIRSLEWRPMVSFKAAKVSASFWVVLFLGFATGTLSGFFGVGGGFLRTPALAYGLGCSTFMAVGTDLFIMSLSGGFGSLRHAMSGNVDLTAAVIMLVGAAVGAQIGAQATRYVRGPSIRLILAYSILLAIIGAALRLGYVLTGRVIELLRLSAVAFTLGEMTLLVCTIIGLMVFGLLAQRGRPVPRRLRSLVISPAQPADGLPLKES
jgi:hypothetical protein